MTTDSSKINNNNSKIAELRNTMSVKIAAIRKMHIENTDYGFYAAEIAQIKTQIENLETVNNNIAAWMIVRS